MATGLNSHAGNDPVLELAADRIPDPPYAGIRPFEENEWPIFFGRQAIIEELLERLSGRRFVSVLSPVGMGLIGLRCGAVARWKTPAGEEGSAQVEGILYQPEASGDYTV